MVPDAAARFPAAAAILCAGVGALVIADVTGSSKVGVLAPLVLLVAILAVGHRALLSWTGLLAGVVLLVLFVSIKRYELPASLPFNLEPYRILVALFILFWALSLLVDPSVRLQRSAFDAPLALIVAAVLGSELLNPGTVQALSSNVWKSLTFALSFLLVYYFTVSVVTTRRQLMLLACLLVAGTAIVAAGALVERRTGVNLFYRYGDRIPLLEVKGGSNILDRGGRLRVYATAQHPIALGALFAMMIPIGFSLGHARGRFWWIPTGLLLLGVMATASRTPIVMLAVAGGIFYWLKPRAIKRLWPLAVPALLVVHIALPGALGTLKSAFFPAGGLIAEQSDLAQNANPELAGGRLRLLRPSLGEWSRHPLGQGYGTRITGFDTPQRNAPILDDQWLGTLLEIGAVGFAAWLWLFVRSVRRLARASREGSDPDEWLFAGFAAAIASFAVGMVTYDAFSFIQVTIVFWIILGLAAVALRLRESGRQHTELAPE